MSFAEVLKWIGTVWIIVIALLPVLIVMRWRDESDESTAPLTDEDEIVEDGFCEKCGNRPTPVQPVQIKKTTVWMCRGCLEWEDDFFPSVSLPLSKDFAAREALKAMPKPPLSRVMIQAEASKNLTRNAQIHTSPHEND